MAFILVTFWLTNIFIALLWLLLWVTVRRDLTALKVQMAELKGTPTDQDLPFAEEVDT